MKNLFSGEAFYKVCSVVGNLLVDMTEAVIKQWLGTVVGGRFMKWFTDILVTRFYDQTIRVFTRVGIIRLGYHYDENDADNIIKKLNQAEAENNDEIYMRTLNDALRSNRVPKP